MDTLILSIGVLMILLVLITKKNRRRVKILNEQLRLCEQNLSNPDREAECPNCSTVAQKDSFSTASVSDKDKLDNAELTIKLICEYMEQKRPYLDSGFNMNRLCEAMGINRTYLSNAINQEAGIRFETFVNSYRIADAIELLCSEESAQYTLEFLATEVGFKSKSTFNRSFKYFTQVNPSFFQKRIAPDEAALKFFLERFEKKRFRIISNALESKEDSKILDMHKK